MTKTNDEMSFLESVTGTYVTSESPQDRAIKLMAIRTFAPFLDAQGAALELGCCDGFMTSLIAPLVRDLHVVDGSATFLEATRRRELANVTLEHSLFEDFTPARKFDFVFACYVLEHVADASDLLLRIGKLLSSRGLAFIVVPNARAMSRQLARHMGILSDLHSLTPNDVNHGHRRVYDRQSLNKDLSDSGFHQLAQGGLMLKPFADFQMNQLMDSGVVGDAQLDGLYRLGLEYPDLCGSLFSICQKP